MSYVSMELSFASLSVKSSVLNNLFGLSPGHRNISIHLVLGSHNIIYLKDNKASPLLTKYSKTHLTQAASHMKIFSFNLK